jgi:hypothetical protein
MRYSDIAASARRVGHARRQHPVDRDSKHANPFATVIRCTADGKPDSKTISNCGTWRERRSRAIN